MPLQGINALTYDPTYNQIASDQLVTDIINLGSTLPADKRPLMMRSKVESSPSDNTLAIGNFQTAFQRYTNQGIATHAILPLEFDRKEFFSPDHQPNSQLWPAGLNNDYINDFSNRAMDFANQLTGNGLRSYFIWNEPNNVGHACELLPQNFAALLYQCYHRLKSVPGIGMVYAGSLTWPFGTFDPPTSTQRVRDYLAQVKAHLDANGGGVPFDALTVNVNHYDFSLGDMQTLRDALVGSSGVYPGKTLFIGEWGVTEYESSIPGATLQAYSNLKPICFAMWFYQHTRYTDPNGDVWGATNWGTGAGNPVPVVPTTHMQVWDQLRYLYQWPDA